MRRADVWGNRVRQAAALMCAVAVFAMPLRAQDQAPVPAVIVAPVTEQVLSFSDRFIGRVDAVNHIDLRARVTGFVEAVNFREGQSVAADDILFEIEPDAYEAAVAQIEGQIASAQAEMQLAQIELQRQQELFQRGTAPEARVQEAEANLGNIEGQIQQLQAALRQAQLDLSYTRIAAPFAGRVGLTDIDVGAFVGPETGALAALSSIDPIYVTFPVAEATLIDVRNRHAASGGVGEVEASLTLANGDTYGQTGTIAVVDTVVQTGTDTVLIRASFPNADGALLDGQLVTVSLVEEDTAPSLTVPVKALQQDRDGYFVFTVDDRNEVAKAAVQVDRIQGAIAVVSSGLDADQRVITDGLQKAQPGMTVDAQTATPATAPASE